MYKRAVVSAVAKYGINPIMTVVAGYVPWWSLLETTGRRTGRPRSTPVTDGLQGDTFWIVSEHGRTAAYVKNIEADPRVRVRARGRWRTGTAHLMPEEDTVERRRLLGHPLNGALVRLVGTDLMTIRIDLDPDQTEGAR